jgi:PhnB protein
MSVKPVPNEQQPMAPYICTKGADKAIAFYVKAFGATESFALREPNGKIGHAELEIAGARLLLSEEYPDFGALSPQTIGGTPVSIHLYVADVDAFVARAEAAGATLLRPIRDEFYGDRVAMLACPFGHKWHIATRKENVSPAEMQTRMNAAYA